MLRGGEHQPERSSPHLSPREAELLKERRWGRLPGPCLHACVARPTLTPWGTSVRLLGSCRLVWKREGRGLSSPAWWSSCRGAGPRAEAVGQTRSGAALSFPYAPHHQATPAPPPPPRGQENTHVGPLRGRRPLQCCCGGRARQGSGACPRGAGLVALPRVTPSPPQERSPLGQRLCEAMLPTPGLGAVPQPPRAAPRLLVPPLAFPYPSGQVDAPRPQSSRGGWGL